MSEDWLQLFISGANTSAASTREVAAEITRLRQREAQLVEACQFALDTLENLTTEHYRKGGDFQARQRLRQALATQSTSK